MSIKMITSSNDVSEIASLPATQIKTKLGITITQELKIYVASDENGKYYILESTQKNFGGITRSYAKLTQESLIILKGIS